jgi:hypothetical protein
MLVGFYMIFIDFTFLNPFLGMLYINIYYIHIYILYYIICVWNWGVHPSLLDLDGEKSWVWTHWPTKWLDPKLSWDILAVVVPMFQHRPASGLRGKRFSRWRAQTSWLRGQIHLSSISLNMCSSGMIPRILKVNSICKITILPFISAQSFWLILIPGETWMLSDLEMPSHLVAPSVPLTDPKNAARLVPKSSPISKLSCLHFFAFIYI